MLQNLFFRKSCCLWGNAEKCDKARQAINENITQGTPVACWITKDKHTHSEHVVLIAFPLQQRLSECTSTLSYTHFAYLISHKTSLNLINILFSPNHHEWQIVLMILFSCTHICYKENTCQFSPVARAMYARPAALLGCGIALRFTLVSTLLHVQGAAGVNRLLGVMLYLSL
jgi:hypothetical protein